MSNRSNRLLKALPALAALFFLLFFVNPLHSQIRYDEITLHHPLPKITCSLGVLPERGVYLTGVAETTWSAYAMWANYYLYYVRLDSLHAPVFFHLLPDKGEATTDYFDGGGYSDYLMQSVLPMQQNAIMFYVKQRNDNTGFYPGRPVAHAMGLDEGSGRFGEIFSSDNGISPMASSDTRENVYFTWEVVNSSSDDHAYYNNAIFNWMMQVNGSFYTPVFIDSGSNPFTVTDAHDFLHLFYFSLDSVSHRSFELRYAKLRNYGVYDWMTFSTGLALETESWSRPVTDKFMFNVNEEGDRVHVGWYDQSGKIYALGYSNHSVRIDSLATGCRYCESQFLYNDKDTTVFALWHSQDSLNQNHRYISSNLNGPIFSEIKQLPDFSGYMGGKFFLDPVSHLPVLLYMQLHAGFHFVSGLLQNPVDVFIPFPDFRSLEDVVVDRQGKIFGLYQDSSYDFHLIQFFDVLTGVSSNGHPLPEAFALAQNYPNPFNPTTDIAFDLPVRSHVILKVYTVLGEEVSTLIDRDMIENGVHSIKFNASHLPSGVYFYRMSAEAVEINGTRGGKGFSAIKKMVVIK